MVKVYFWLQSILISTGNWSNCLNLLLVPQPSGKLLCRNKVHFYFCLGRCNAFSFFTKTLLAYIRKAKIKHTQTYNISIYIWCFNSSPPKRNGRHFTDDWSRCIFVKEKYGILIQISLELVPKGPFDNKATLVRVMAWRRIVDKPLSEPMLTRLTDAYMRHSEEMS